MDGNSYQRLKEIISELDFIFKKGKLALIKANGYDYVISGYHISKDFIMLYFGKDFLDAYHYFCLLYTSPSPRDS